MFMFRVPQATDRDHRRLLFTLFLGSALNKEKRINLGYLGYPCRKKTQNGRTYLKDWNTDAKDDKIRKIIVSEEK
jgi:hypothetical protein